MVARVRSLQRAIPVPSGDFLPLASKVRDSDRWSAPAGAGIGASFALPRHGVIKEGDRFASLQEPGGESACAARPARGLAATTAVSALACPAHSEGSGVLPTSDRAALPWRAVGQGLPPPASSLWLCT